MGKNEGWAQPSGDAVLPNGLLPNAGPVIPAIDPERWLKAEERTAELIACIQPNTPSEERRNAVADYVQRLIMKCFPCQVFTFGSVPLKTYLPDGDIDLTAFSNSQTLKDTWANQVRDVLENEEKNENAEFRVKEVQYIQAEVKLIKCLVENIVVDISFNQLGGLCTLCFLEEVDDLISQNHLFKRSIILIKAWCYYESRVLGAHHGLISTYALETLVLYIFHVFNNSFTGPFEVLCRFLEFFSNFDWDNFCVSLWGPVPITSLPDVTAKPPRKDRGELLLSKFFLDACSSVYAVLPGGQENQGQHFVSKHFNVIDPLRVNNNLGRSVSKGNFFRIRSAFAFGAKRLASLLECPKEKLVHEVNEFFTNTWDRHGSGNRPDAANTDLLRSRLLTPDYSHGSESLKNGSSAKKVSGNVSDWGTEVDKAHSRKSPSQHGDYPLEIMPKITDPTLSQTRKVYGLKSSRVFDQAIRESNPKVYIDKGQKTVGPDLLVNNIPGRFLFARTRSSPELTKASVGFSPQGRCNNAPEVAKNQGAFTRIENNNEKNQGSENLDNYGVQASVGDHSSIRHVPSHQSLDTVESNSSLNSYRCNSDLGVPWDELPSNSGALRMDEEEQDLVNMMASTSLHSFNGQIHMPLNLSSGHLPFPISPSILASMGYGHRNFSGMIPPNINFIDPSLAHMQFPQGIVPPSLAQYYPGIQLNSNSEDMIEPNNGNFVPLQMNPEDGDRDLWQEQDVVSPGGAIHDNSNYEILQLDDKPQPSSLGLKFVPSTRGSSKVSSSTNQQNFTKENRGPMIEVYPHQDNGNDYSDDRTTASRLSSAGRSSSLRSRTSSESSWDGSSAKVSRTTKEKREKKTARAESTSSYEKVKNVSELNIQPGEDDEVWDTGSTMCNDMTGRSSPLQSVGSLHDPMPQIHGYEIAQTSGSDAMVPTGPVLLDHGLRQKAMDNSGVVFYPTGPPVPFVTMLPLYNVPPETGNAGSSTSHFGGEEGMDNSDPRQHFDTSEKLHQIKELQANPSRAASFAETSNEKKPDILSGDLARHRENLLFGRFCQNPHSRGGPMVCPSPLDVPPMYLQGRVPFDGPGRPQPANMNLFTQLMGYGPHLIPVTSFPSTSNRPPAVYQHYVEEIPRQRSGTGTYLPIPKVSPRERNSSGPRRGNYNFERNDHQGDGERNWSSPKSRAAGRNHIRSQNEKSNSRVDRLNSNDSRADRPWNSYRRDSFSSYQVQNSHLRSNSSQSTTPTPSMAYSMYPVQAMNPNGVSSNGPNVPSAVMFYPVDHNASFDTLPEQLEFGSFGPMGFSSSNEQRQVNEGNRPRGAFDEQSFHRASMRQSSPDQPSSPHYQRGA